jgi:hypothetical protein
MYRAEDALDTYVAINRYDTRSHTG